MCLKKKFKIQTASVLRIPCKRSTVNMSILLKGANPAIVKSKVGVMIIYHRHQEWHI